MEKAIRGEVSTFSISQLLIVWKLSDRLSVEGILYFKEIGDTLYGDKGRAPHCGKLSDRHCCLKCGCIDICLM
jgi:hypothetical protein